MLLRWLCLALWALGIIVGRTWSCMEPGSRTAWRDRRRRRSPSSPANPSAAPPRLPGSDPRLHMLSGGITLLIQALAFVRWTDVGARLRTASGLHMASAVAFQAGEGAAAGLHCGGAPCLGTTVPPG